MVAAIRYLIVAPRPRRLVAARAAGFAAQGNLKPLSEEHRAIQELEIIPSIESGRRAEYAKRILRTEECGDVHVNARPRLIVKVIPYVDALGIHAFLGSWPAFPDIHVMPDETAGTHGIKQYDFPIRLRIEREIHMVIVIPCTVIRAELVSLHAGTQQREIIEIEIGVYTCGIGLCTPGQQAPAQQPGSENDRC